VQRSAQRAGRVTIPDSHAQRVVFARVTIRVLSTESRIPSSPSITVELEPAFQTLDAALDLRQVVRLAASRAGGVVCIGV